MRYTVWMIFSLMMNECDLQSTDVWMWSSVYWCLNVIFSLQMSECDLQSNDNWMWSSVYWCLNVIFSLLMSECDLQSTDVWMWSSVYWFSLLHSESDCHTEYLPNKPGYFFWWQEWMSQYAGDCWTMTRCSKGRLVNK